MRRATSAAIISTWVALLTAAPELRAAGPVQVCQVAKMKAAAKKLGAKTSCVAKAKLKATAVDSTCLMKAEAKFSAAFAKAGTVCPGTAAGIETLVDGCVATLAGDVPGDGKCPGTKAKTAGKATARELGCAEKNIVKPGTFAACDAKSDAKLGADLAKAGACPDSGTLPADVDDCRMQISAALSATTTTSTTTSSSTTTTIIAPTCGNTVINAGEQCDVAAGPCAELGFECGQPGAPHECQCCATSSCITDDGFVWPCCGNDVCVQIAFLTGACIPATCTVPGDCPEDFTCVASQCCLPTGAFCGNPLACGLCCGGTISGFCL